jgi:hypothetical protein
MRRTLSLAAGLLAGLLASGQASADPKAFVELFTSQGCSSCVSADAYFAELVKRRDVVAISMHVDYWDYLGWRDTLGDPAYTDRQKNYAAVHGTRRVYTPQMIVNGANGFVGSDRASIEPAIEESTLSVPVRMHHGDGTVEIEVAPAPDSSKTATIRLVLLTSKAEVAIARGENAGRTIDYHNVVREIRPIGMWHGETVKISLPEDEIMADGVDTCAIIVQEELPNGPGAIVGAAMLHNW